MEKIVELFASHFSVRDLPDQKKSVKEKPIKQRKKSKQIIANKVKPPKTRTDVSKSRKCRTVPTRGREYTVLSYRHSRNNSFPPLENTLHAAFHNDGRVKTSDIKARSKQVSDIPRLKYQNCKAPCLVRSQTDLTKTKLDSLSTKIHIANEKGKVEKMPILDKSQVDVSQNEIQKLDTNRKTNPTGNTLTVSESLINQTCDEDKSLSDRTLISNIDMQITQCEQPSKIQNSQNDRQKLKLNLLPDRRNSSSTASMMNKSQSVQKSRTSHTNVKLSALSDKTLLLDIDEQEKPDENPVNSFPCTVQRCLPHLTPINPAGLLKLEPLETPANLAVKTPLPDVGVSIKDGWEAVPYQRVKVQRMKKKSKSKRKTVWFYLLVWVHEYDRTTGNMTKKPYPMKLQQLDEDQHEII